MPTYAYRCAGCFHELESLQKITAKPLTCCPQCGQETLVRGPGGGTGLLFQGSGFYCTDYPNGSKKTAVLPESTSCQTSPQSETTQPAGCSHSGCGCIGKNT